jgi:hypothetical protein
MARALSLYQGLLVSGSKFSTILGIYAQSVLAKSDTKPPARMCFALHALQALCWRLFRKPNAEIRKVRWNGDLFLCCSSLFILQQVLLKMGSKGLLVWGAQILVHYRTKAKLHVQTGCNG